MAGPLQAEVPREFGKSLRACVCCKLVKTFDQVLSSCCAATLLVVGACEQRCPAGVLLFMQPQLSRTHCNRVAFNVHLLLA